MNCPQLHLALIGMAVAYLLGRARMAAERPMGGVSHTWIVTKDSRLCVMMKAEDGSGTLLSLNKDATRKVALAALEQEES